MSRPRTPTNVLKIRGVEKVHPERIRARKHEPKESRDLGTPPAHLTADQKKAWREIARTAIDGVLSHADRLAVETACKLLVKMRADKMNSAEMNQWTRLLSQFGMTPADRSKIIIPKSFENEFSDF